MRFVRGPILILWIGLASSAVLGLVLLLAGTELDALRMAVRVTARVSFLAFLPVFVASSIQRLWPSQASLWLMRNRRYLGLGFGLAHLVHLSAIVLLLLVGFDRDLARLGGWSGVLPGGAIYLLLIAMMASSNDGAVRLLSFRRWKLLHRVGIWAVLVGFIKGLLLAQGSPSVTYTGFQALLFAAIGLRLAAWIRTRRAARAILDSRRRDQVTGGDDLHDPDAFKAGLPPRDVHGS